MLHGQVYIGDFMQLPPPGISGTPLTEIPDFVLGSTIAKNMTAQHGLELLWQHTQCIIELTKQMRSDGDQWWNEVFHECRYSKMEPDTHSFRHGNPTSVPGSWLKSLASTTCGRDCVWSYKHQGKECQKCKTERTRRHRVLDGSSQQNKQRACANPFDDDVVLVANNDIKFDICKRRAAGIGRKKGMKHRH